MIKHIVMWKLKKEKFLENAKKIKNDLESLKDKINFIKNISVKISENSINNNDSYNVILISSFDNFSDLDKYQNNSEHKKIVDFIKTCTLDRAFIDYEDEVL